MLYGHAYQLSIRINVKTIIARVCILHAYMRNGEKTKYIHIETIVETKQNVNFLLAATVHVCTVLPQYVHDVL